MLKSAGVWSALVLAAIPAGAHAAVGHTPATAQVSPAGEATYTVPIAVPPGVNGLTPQLALVYSHRSGQTIAGAGWGIAGADVIARCNSTVIQDGVARNVRNDAQDRFCLNGNKLRLISGTYGAAGSEYRTEIETYSRIKAYGAAGNGPTYFIVEGKDGLIYEFGNTANSRIESVGQTTARAWALNRIRDRDGNEIVFAYTEDATNGSYHLNYVDYAGNPTQGTTAIYRVDLIYEDKPAGEIDSGYIAGSLVKETKRLDRIDVLYNGTTLYRRYNLTYEASLSATSLSRLASITECAGPGPSCFSPTQFTYLDGAPLAAEVNTTYTVPSTPMIPLDVNGDGREDLVYSSSTGSGTWMVMFANASGGYDAPVNTTRSNTGYLGAITIDYNQDGKGDLLVPYSGGTWWVMLGSSSGLGALTNTGAPATATGTGSNARAMDVDGDGRDDLVWADLVGWAGGDAIRYRLRLSGSGFSATATDLVSALPANQMIPTGLFTLWQQKMPSRIPDFNGDGRKDIVYRRRMRESNQLLPGDSSSSSVEATEGGASTLVTYNYFYFIDVACPGVSNCFSSATGLTNDPYFGDFNGDGQDDIFYLDGDSHFKYRLSTGTSFGPELDTGVGSAYGDVLIYDWDGDGCDDVLAGHVSTSTWHVLRSTGEVLLSPVSTGVPQGGTTVVTDLNGDHQPDIAYQTGGTWRFRARNVTFDYPDLLRTATDAFGVFAQFGYAPITSSTVYTKGTGAVYPEQDYQRPLWVVNTLTQTDGTGNNSNYTLTYTYEAARLHLTGRGFEGFAKRTVVDNRLSYNLKTIETYRQDYPYIGAPLSVERQQSTGTRISLTSNTWKNLSWGAAGSTLRNFPYVSSQSRDEHEVVAPMNGTKFHNVTTTVAATGGIDSTSGLILDATTTTTDVINAESKTERIQHTGVFNDIVNWCLGRPSASQLTNAHTLPNGTTITRSFDATWDGLKCRPTQQRAEPASATWKVTVDLQYDAFGNVNSETVTGVGMAARTTLSNWGTRGQFPQTITNPLNQGTTLGWNDALGLQASVTDPNNLATSWTYDEFGRPATETRPDGTSTVWTFGACGCSDARQKYYVQQDERSSAPAVFRTSTRYFNRFDVAGWEQVQRLDTDVAYLAIRNYDARGRVIKEYVPYYSGQSANGDRRWTYDLLDRVVTDKLYTAGGAQERSTSYAYAGLATTVTDPLSHATTRTVSAWGDVLSVTDAASGVMSHQYDAFGLLKKTTDALNNVVYQASYNVRGVRTQSIDADLGTWNYTPDALGEVVSQTDAKSQVTTLVYDKLGRLKQRDESEGTSLWNWGTSAGAHNIGRLASLSGPGYSESYTYDSVGRPSTRSITSDATYQYDFAYNNIGQLYTLAYPTSTSGVRVKLKYLYSNGYLSTIRDFTGDVDGTTYWALNAMNARGQAIDEAYGTTNGLWLQSTFAPLTGLISTRQSGTGGSATNVQNLAYTWDTADNLTQRQDLRQSLLETFSYDALDRLQQSSDPNGTLTIGYNAIGNVTSRSDVGGGATWTYHATKKHAVTAAGSFTFGYDANGNVANRNGSVITWMSYNLPATINGGGYSAAFDYTLDRARWRQVSSYPSPTLSETTVYVGELMEKLTTGSPARTSWKHRIPTPSGEVQQIRRSDGTTETLYLPSDHLGSVDAVLNAAGTVVVRTSFNAWGARRDDDWVGLPSSGDNTNIANTTRRGYTGHEMLDNVGLVHMNGRVYDPAVGRFISADPYIDCVQNAQGWNRYAYVRNRSLSLVDPSGFGSRIPPKRPIDPSPFEFGSGPEIAYEFQHSGHPDVGGSQGGEASGGGASRPSRAQRHAQCMVECEKNGKVLAGLAGAIVGGGVAMAVAAPANPVLAFVTGGALSGTFYMASLDSSPTRSAAISVAAGAGDGFSEMAPRSFVGGAAGGAVGYGMGILNANTPAASTIGGAFGGYVSSGIPGMRTGSLAGAAGALSGMLTQALAQKLVDAVCTRKCSK